MLNYHENGWRRERDEEKDEGDKEEDEDEENVEDEGEENEERKVKWKARILPNHLFNCMMQLPNKTYISTCYLLIPQLNILGQVNPLINPFYPNRVWFNSTQLNSMQRLDYAKTRLGRMSQQ
ncbi:hypothetical protein JCGZ_05309 [Jatropha curcas]|uniref:Uncharacterized protein n=1 Tax=Jatropha curcas TaxID=180498 RepID=A0A067KR27_JATCU|nr:hypothetical protein JCGZ_05309 [Jatropha curcas]